MFVTEPWLTPCELQNVSFLYLVLQEEKEELEIHLLFWEYIKLSDSD
jgi:hypothetical protein